MNAPESGAADCPDVCIVGGGKVATALHKAFNARGINVLMLSSRTLLPVAECGANGAGADSFRAARVVLLAVSDDAIASVAGRIDSVDGIIAHTSGSVGLDALKGCKAKGWGVFYPLQTFSKDRKVDLTHVPILIEGDGEDCTDTLTCLAKRLSDNVLYADSAQRAALHVAAVFACNFTNALYVVSKNLLANVGLPFEILDPLLHETLDKAMAIGPENAQTGPAMRRDTAVIDRHLKSLPAELASLYSSLTNLIYEQNKL